MANAIEVIRCKECAYVRVTGLGNFNNAAAFREWVEGQIQQGARKVVIELAGCVGLDSTFMGTMMGFLTCPLEGYGDTQELADTCVKVVVLNASDAAMRAMKSLGLDSVMTLREDSIAVPSVKLKLLNAGQITQQQRIRLIREAHENLAELDPANEKIFAPFLDALLKDA